MLKQKYFLTGIFILSAERQPIKLAWRKIVWLPFLDLAEDRAKRHIPMTMEDWAKRIDKFLDSDDRPILNDSGKMSAEQAKDYAETEFEKYRIFQDRVFQSDFDKLNTTRSNTK